MKCVHNGFGIFRWFSVCASDKISKYINCVYFYDGSDYKDTANRAEPAYNGKTTLYCH